MNHLAAYMLFCSVLSAQVADSANSAYKTPEGRAGMAGTLGDPDRPQRLQAQKIVASMGLKPGMTVADLGAGTGAMLPALSQAAGSNGKVIAQDIYQDFLDRAKQHAGAERLSNVSYVLGTVRDPKLPDGCCDLVLSVDAYHHFDYPADTLAGIRKALKPGGRLVIVEYYKREGAMGPGRRAIEHVRLDMDDAVKEIESNGFQTVSAGDHVPGSQWIGIFTKKPN